MSNPDTRHGRRIAAVRQAATLCTVTRESPLLTAEREVDFRTNEGVVSGQFLNADEDIELQPKGELECLN